MRSISVIVPTYHEAANLPELVARIDAVRAADLAHLELIVVDDNSSDGVEGVIARLRRDWVRLLVRRHQRCLSGAVVDGLKQARGEMLVVMDADLSHPPERIGDLVKAVERGADFALGSRYATGGSTDARWSAWRWINSRVATLLARPLTRVGDPLSGFFALRRSTFESAAPLNPIGYKIGLELMVKCDCRRVEEVPIHFSDRTRGRSKLTLRQQWLYVRHVLGLLRFRAAGRASRGEPQGKAAIDAAGPSADDSFPRTCR